MHCANNGKTEEIKVWKGKVAIKLLKQCITNYEGIRNVLYKYVHVLPLSDCLCACFFFTVSLKYSSLPVQKLAFENAIIKSIAINHWLMYLKV